MELEREFSGGLRSRWYRDRLGRPVKQETLTGGDFSQRTRTYQWQVNDRLQQIEDSQRGLTRFGHDDLGNLAWSENPDGSMLYRMPDAVGNLFRTKDRKDRIYGRSGQLLQSGTTRYKYDAEGNLIRKTGEGGKEWHYEWDAAGMLRRVTCPDGETVAFTYDALGRRLSKTYRGRTTRWIWDGNIPLHEWVEQANMKATAKQQTLEAGANGGHQSEDLVTWLFEPESFAPLAKLTKASTYDFISDHLGTPVSMHAATGEAVWSAELNAYGEVLNLRGKAEDCPFRYPGQYEDVETGLYYNRFRYYDPREGIYVSQDPIGLSGGMTLYTYVHDTNIWQDVFGLTRSCVPNKGSERRKRLDKKFRSIRNTKGNNTLKGSINTKEADYLGNKWVGENHKLVTTKKGNEIWISIDGERQYRRPTVKSSPYTKTGKQANYQRRSAPAGEWEDNAHLDIND